MRATEYGSTNMIYFNSSDILYVVKNGFECKTYLTNGRQISLSLKEMKVLLDKMPRVFSYKLYLPIYLNPKEIANFSTDGVVVNVEFNNGKKLLELSRIHFYQNVVPKIEQERDLYNRLN